MRASSAKYKVILDTDPGVDDAVALFFALAHPEIELVGVTTIFGNVSVAQATVNALYLTRIAGYSIPVAQGASVPVFKNPGKHPDLIHGHDGLGNLTERFRNDACAETKCAAEFIVSMARQHPGEITFVAVGPLTNLALALALEPRLPELLKQVAIMGGAIDEPGNVSPVAEANIWHDPHAADLVFGAGFDLTMVGLDVTHRVVLPSALFLQLEAQHQHVAMETLRHATAFYCNFYQSVRPEIGPGCFGHDVLAFAWLVAPELFGTETGRIRVATEGIGNGQTMLARRKSSYQQAGWESTRPATRVCMTVDSAPCQTLVAETLARTWLRTPLVAAAGQ